MKSYWASTLVKTNSYTLYRCWRYNQILNLSVTLRTHTKAFTHAHAQRKKIFLKDSSIVSGRINDSSENRCLNSLCRQWQWIFLNWKHLKWMSYFKHLSRGGNRRGENNINKTQTSKRQVTLEHRCLNLGSQISPWNCFMVLSRDCFIWSI